MPGPAALFSPMRSSLASPAFNLFELFFPTTFSPSCTTNMQFLWKSSYYKLPNVEDDEKSNFSPLRGVPNPVTWRLYIYTLLPWVLTLFFASVAFVEHLSRTQVSSLGSYSTGWKTDMGTFLYQGPLISKMHFSDSFYIQQPALDHI